MTIRKIIDVAAFAVFLVGAALNHQVFHIRWIDIVTGLGILAYTVVMVVVCGMFVFAMHNASRNPGEVAANLKEPAKIRAAINTLDRNWFKFVIGMYPVVLIALAGHPIQAVLLIVVAFGMRHSLYRSLYRMTTVIDRIPV